MANLQPRTQLHTLFETGAKPLEEDFQALINSASNFYEGTEFNTHSDVRIKKVQGCSYAQDDLAVLQQIEIIDYTFKDKITYDSRPHKKVLGQQVAQVFPQAVTTQTNVIPDIFRRAIALDGWIKLSHHGLQMNDRVRLLIEGIDPKVYTVETVQPDCFQVSPDQLAPNYGGTVFVYGREVKDFHSVDYNALSMLNISATQALTQTVNALKAEIQQLRLQLDSGENSQRPVSTQS